MLRGLDRPEPPAMKSMPSFCCVCADLRTKKRPYGPARRTASPTFSCSCR